MEPQSEPVANPAGIAVGDFNGDGKDDMAVVNQAVAGGVGVMLSNGDGTLQPPVNYPAGANTVDLSDIGLSDHATKPYKFAFPPGTVLDPGDRLVVYADSGAGGGFWTGFGLDQDGDALYLFDKPGNGGALLDSVVFGPQLADRSIGRNTGCIDGSWR